MDVVRDLVSRIQSDPKLMIASAVIGILLAIVVFVLGRKSSSKTPSHAEPKSTTKDASDAAQSNKAKAKKSEKKEAEVAPSAPIKSAGPDHPLHLVRLKGFKNAIDSAVFSPDGRYLGVCDSSRVVRVYFAESLSGKDHRYIQVNMEDDNAMFCDFSSTGGDMIVGMADKQRIAAYQILEKKGKENKHYVRKAQFATEHKHPLKSVLLAPSAAYILSCSTETEVLVWNLQGKVIEKIDTKQVKNYCAAISPDSRFFAVGCFTADVKVWEALYDKKTNIFMGIKKHQVMDLKGHKRGVLGISFSPDSKKVATASVDGTWRLWDINVRYEMQEDPKVIFSVTNPVDPAIPFSHVSISPDGGCVATATANNVHFWSAKDGSLLGEVLAAHSKAISSLSWSKNGEWLSSGSHDMTVGIWKRPVV